MAAVQNAAASDRSDREELQGLFNRRVHPTNNGGVVSQRSPIIAVEQHFDALVDGLLALSRYFEAVETTEHRNVAGRQGLIEIPFQMLQGAESKLIVAGRQVVI